MDIMGLDPGQRGAAALLRRDIDRHQRLTTRFVEMVDLQMIPDGERKQVDVDFLGELIERWAPDVAVIENVQVAVPPQEATTFGGGRRSAMSPSDAFRFGLACGMIRATVMAYKVPVVLVHPRSWTLWAGLGADKKHGIAKAPKSEHISRLVEVMPSAAQYLTLQRHDGRADSGWLAYFHAMKTGML